MGFTSAVKLVKVGGYTGRVAYSGQPGNFVIFTLECLGRLCLGCTGQGEGAVVRGVGKIYEMVYVVCPPDLDAEIVHQFPLPRREVAEKVNLVTVNVDIRLEGARSGVVVVCAVEFQALLSCHLSRLSESIVDCHILFDRCGTADFLPYGILGEIVLCRRRGANHGRQPY